MTIGHIGEDFRALSWVGDGWLALRERAHNALTPFRQQEPADDAADDATGEVAAERRDSSSRVQASWGLVAADVTVLADHVDVRVEIPGMSRDELRVEIRGGRLFVSGEKRREETRDEGNLTVTERAFGHFYRAVQLPPDAVAEGAAATYEDGVLKIMLKRSENAGIHQVPVA